MSVHCQCPRCSDPVTLPDGYAGDATVRCPLCDAEYTLDEAMQHAPPTLIVVDPGSTVPVEATPIVAGSEQADADIGMPWASDDDGEIGIIETEATETPAEAAEADLDSGFGGFSPSVSSSSVSATPTASASRKKKKGNPVGQMIQVVIGGLMAVVIVYYILNAMGKKEWDKGIYLPFVKHTHTMDHFGYSWFFDEDGYTGNEESSAEDEDIPLPNADDYADPNEDVSNGTLDGSTDTTDTTDPTSIDDGTGLDPGLDMGAPDELDPSDFSDDGGDDDDFDLSGVDLGDIPDAEPAPTVTETVAAISFPGAPKFTPAQVGEALKAVQEGYGCPNCNSRGFITNNGKDENCPKCNGAPNLAIDKKALTLFKNLAEALAFAEGDVRDRQIATEKKFELLSEQGAMEQIGTSAAFQLFNESGKKEAGILFQGEVQKVENAGDQQIITVLIEGFRAGSPAVVVTAPGVKSSVKEGDTIGVLGYSIKDPKSKLSDYAGDEDMIVWAGCIAPLY